MASGTAPITSNHVSLAIPMHKPGDAPPAAAMTKGARIDSSDPNILAGRTYLIKAELTRTEKLSGWAQRYNVSPYIVGLAAIALISGFALLLLAQSAGAILAGKVIGLIGLSSTVYQLLTSMVQSSYLNIQLKTGSTELHEAVIASGKSKASKYDWLKCALRAALRANKCQLAQKGKSNKTPLDLAKDANDLIAIEMLQHASTVQITEEAATKQKQE